MQLLQGTKWNIKNALKLALFICWGADFMLMAKLFNLGYLDVI